MRRHSMSGSDARRKLRPRNDQNWHQVRVLIGYLALIAIFISAAVVFKHKRREDMEQNWKSATAIIEDVRPKAMTVMESERGGGMLYEVAVLAKYSSDGVDQERWITVQQQLETLSDAKLQAFRWKGKQCIVRWKPSDPSKIFATVS
jgi:hypothetical protein